MAFLLRLLLLIRHTRAIVILYPIITLLHIKAFRSISQMLNLLMQTSMNLPILEFIQS